MHRNIEGHKFKVYFSIHDVKSNIRCKFCHHVVVSGVSFVFWQCNLRNVRAELLQYQSHAGEMSQHSDSITVPSFEIWEDICTCCFLLQSIAGCPATKKYFVLQNVYRVDVSETRVSHYCVDTGVFKNTETLIHTNSEYLKPFGY